MTHTIEWSPEAIAVVQKLAKKWRVGESEILRRGIALLNMLDEEYADELGNVGLQVVGNRKIQQFNLRTWNRPMR